MYNTFIREDFNVFTVIRCRAAAPPKAETSFSQLTVATAMGAVELSYLPQPDVDFRSCKNTSKLMCNGVE